MELFRNVRLKIGQSFLAKKIARTKRKVNYSNIILVKKIGIVWDASKHEEFACLSRFHQKMQERNIEVRLLGYFQGKELPDKYTAIRYLTLIRKNDINFIYHPVSPESTAFLNTRFDVLIDINFKKLLPLKYISSLSNAGLKVGLFEKEIAEPPFDIMMEIKYPVDIDIYLNHIVQYLEMIKS